MRDGRVGWGHVGVGECYRKMVYDSLMGRGGCSPPTRGV